MKFLTIIAAAMLWLFGASTPAVAGKSERILLVISSHGETGGVRPGYEMDELSQAYLVFAANGYELDIASPDGGSSVPDEYDADKAYNASFLADPVATAKLADSLALGAVDPADYSAIFVIGGKGAMFDLPKSEALVRAIAAIDANGGVVGAVCHGPAVLAMLRDEAGKPWIAGRKLTGFSNEEEANFGKKWVPEFPFLIETEMKRLGADFSAASMMLGHVVVDGRLVTGQNPFSVGRAAEAVISALGKEPVARTQWADEHAMELVAVALDGNLPGARTALAAQPEAYDVQLIGAWGYYRAMNAKGDRTLLREALIMMELAEPYFSPAPLKEAIEKTRAELAS